MNDLVLAGVEENIFEIVLNRPDKRNAINFSMMQALDAAIDEAENTSGIRAVIIRGEGSGFSAGIDLMGFGELVEYFGSEWQQNLFSVTAAMQAVFNKIERCSLPVIALAHGFCLGMGFELALACDFRIVAAGTRLGLPETRLGLIPDVGGTTRLTRLAGPMIAKELIMTGREFDPEYALQRAIVNDVVPAESLVERGHTLVDELVVAAPLAVSYAKKVINAAADIDRGLQLEAWAQSILIRSEDFANGVQALLKKRPADWHGR